MAGQRLEARPARAVALEQVGEHQGQFTRVGLLVEVTMSDGAKVQRLVGRRHGDAPATATKRQRNELAR